MQPLKNKIGAEHFAEFNKPIWEVDLEKGLRLLRLAIDTHLVTSHFALPLLIQKPGGFVVELTDGTADYNNGHYRQAVIYDLAKNAIIRMAWALAQELQPHQCTAVCLTPGWLRSEMMLDCLLELQIQELHLAACPCYGLERNRDRILSFG